MIIETPVKEQYLKLLDLTYEVAQSLKGVVPDDPRWVDCEGLAAKLFFHSASLYSLREPGTKVSSSLLLQGGVSFFDFASTAVLTRSILETYFVIFEVFFEPKSEDGFEFCHAFWLLSGFIVRVEFIPTDPLLKKEYDDALIEIKEMRDRIIKTERYKMMTPKEQRRTLGGNRLSDWKRIAKASGFGEEKIQQMYAYFSGYVHADGLSTTQIVSAKTRNDQIEMIDTHMRFVLLVLSKMIIQYANKFPEARSVCDKKSEVFYLAEIWSGVASNLP